MSSGLKCGRRLPLQRPRRGHLTGPCDWCPARGVELIETRFWSKPLLLCGDCEAAYLVAQMGIRVAGVPEYVYDRRRSNV